MFDEYWSASGFVDPSQYPPFPEEDDNHALNVASDDGNTSTNDKDEYSLAQVCATDSLPNDCSKAILLTACVNQINPGSCALHALDIKIFERLRLLNLRSTRSFVWIRILSTLMNLLLHIWMVAQCAQLQIVLTYFGTLIYCLVILLRLFFVLLISICISLRVRDTFKFHLLLCKDMLWFGATIHLCSQLQLSRLMPWDGSSSVTATPVSPCLMALVARFASIIAIAPLKTLSFLLNFHVAFCSLPL